MREPTITDLMNRSVVTVAPETPFRTVVDLLASNQIGSVPVVDAHRRILGVVSETDVVVKAGRRRHWRRWLKSDRRAARDVMTPEPQTVRENEKFDVAARKLTTSRLRRVYVVAEEQRVVGVLARRDVLRVFLRSDADIQSAIRRDVADRALWASPGEVTVTVHNGVVTVSGTVDRSREAICGAMLIEGYPGVVGVRNLLRYVVDDTVPAG